MMAAREVWRLTVGGCHGMDSSGVLHEYGRVGLIEGRVVGLTVLAIRCAPAGDVVRLGGGRTGAG